MAEGYDPGKDGEEDTCYQYDYLIVGAGLYGAVMAHELHKKGKRCLVIDRRDHIAGNIYCEEIEKEFTYTNTVAIFSTLRIKRCGNISISLRSLTIISILRLLCIRMNYIIFHLI